MTRSDWWSSYAGKPCYWCRRAMENHLNSLLRPTQDHVLPKSRGGTKTEVCCFTCNQLKGDMHPALWKIVLDKRPEVLDMIREPGPRGMSLFYHFFGGEHEPYIDGIIAEAMQRFPEFGGVEL